MEYGPVALPDGFAVAFRPVQLPTLEIGVCSPSERADTVHGAGRSGA